MSTPIGYWLRDHITGQCMGYVHGVPVNLGFDSRWVPLYDGPTPVAPQGELWEKAAASWAAAVGATLSPQDDPTEAIRAIVNAARCAPAPVAQPFALPNFDSFDDETIDSACATGGLYRVDLMRAYEVLRANGIGQEGGAA